MVSTADVRTYVYGTTYDSWNRVRTMTYPDGEVVTYAYNAAGQIVSVKSNKQGKEETIVEEVGYDKEGHTVYTRLGNGTETTYTYDRQRERLQEMNLMAAGAAVMTNKYRYDAVDNILGITNVIDPAKAGGKSQLGGAFSHTYAYDELNRLITASGKAKSASYEMAMTFGRMSEPLTKVQKVDSTRTAQSYDFTYRYEDDSHPTAPTQVGHDHYTYDANGNPILVENDSLNTERRMYWDEDNRLMVLSDNGKTCRYTYNAAGERIVKSHGDLEGVYINGAPQGISFHETEDYTIYPAPIITVTKNRFTKHYFIGSKRIASKIGTGRFSNVYGIGGNNVTAGQKDYAARMMQIEKQREEYYKQLGTPPGVPTMKGATADPDNTGIGYNSIITDLGDHSAPEGWIQHPKFNDKGDVPGPPIQWSEPESPDNAQPGYGYIPADTTDTEDIFFYHSDHLGSTSYITDAKANITQFDAYLPYGELLVDEHTSSEDMPYKFNGKELDQETGLYYYGARYMNPVTSLWYGVDPLAEKYVEIGSYIYCHNNPIILFDPDGMEDKDKKTKALEAISLFEHTKTETVFKNIPKEQFIRDLRNQINNPNTVRQGGNGTCGAAAISKYLAEEQPDLYTRTAISLYTSGVSTNRGVTLSVTDEMKKGTVRDLRSAELKSVDAIMQGAITNRNNGMSEVNTFKGESGINSFMWPSFISSFLKDFAGVHVRSIGVFPTMGALRSIDYNKYFVIGLVHEEGGHITDGLYPNHYVQLLGFNRQNYASFWTWGENRPRKSHVFGLMHGIHQIYMIKR
ncbi:RHS repeat-associated core domain-containing protein [Segatella hominis]|uniref:RHS repeat-associated core domain-containing protein n=1 Tax=Segatella hominis TaxID=2518605 RepID=UPI003F7CE9C4